MEIKAALKIQLLANDVVVAESDDPVLWNRVLQTAQKPATGPKLLTHDPLELEPVAELHTETTIVTTQATVVSVPSQPLQRLAQTLGIAPEMIEGACYPSPEEPYLRVDSHYWAAFKKNTPERGTGAVSAAAVISTLLTQWFKYAELGEVNRSMIYKILKGLGVTTNNFDRGIKTCSWLAIHDSTIRLNPSAIIKADAMMKAFCTKQPVQG